MWVMLLNKGHARDSFGGQIGGLGGVESVRVRLGARDSGFGECAGFVHEVNEVVQSVAGVE